MRLRLQPWAAAGIGSDFDSRPVWMDREAEVVNGCRDADP